MQNPDQFPKIPKNIITGTEQLIMTQVGKYIGNHPEQTVENKREAFAYTFGIIEAVLKTNKDAPLKELAEVYKMMKIGIEFTPEQTKTFARFLYYFEECRNYTKELEAKPRLELFKILTGVELGPEDRKYFTIQRGSFGFIIEADQRIINIIKNRKKPENLIEDIKEKIMPEKTTYGMSYFTSDPDNPRVKCNFIVVPKKDISITDTIESSLSDVAKLRTFLEEDIRFKTADNSKEKIITHETQHSIFSILEGSYRYEKPINVTQEIISILKTRKPDLVTESSFREFCEYLSETAFDMAAANEILATLKESNFIPRFPIVRNSKIYDFSTPFEISNLSEENDFIRELYNGLFSVQKNKNANKFYRIFLDYANKSSQKINALITEIAYAVDKYNLDEEKLTNVLMFENINNWSKIIKSIVSNPKSSVYKKTK